VGYSANRAGETPQGASTAGTYKHSSGLDPQIVKSVEEEGVALRPRRECLTVVTKELCLESGTSRCLILGGIMRDLRPCQKEPNLPTKDRQEACEKMRQLQGSQGEFCGF